MVIRTVKNKNYTCMSNTPLKEKDMSLKAKGLICLILSLPDDWDYSIRGLATLSSDGETAVRNALKELEDFNYLYRERIYENGKIVDWSYTIFENPESCIEYKQNLDVENQQLGKQQLQNTDNKILYKQNKNKLNNNISKDILEVPTSADTQPTFNFGKPKTKGKSRYDLFSDLINSYTNNPKLKKSIFSWIEYITQLRKYKNQGDYYPNQLPNFLDELSKISKSDEDKIKIIDQSIGRGYSWIYNNLSDNNFKRKRNFDNTSDIVNPPRACNMTKDELYETRYKDEDGNLVSF